MSAEPQAAGESRYARLRRYLKRSDLPAFRALLAETRMFSHAEIEVAAELVDESLERGSDSDYRFTVAESAGEVIGYACFGPIPCTVASYDLYWIAVCPSKQRSGVGRQLLDDVEQQIADYGGARVYVDTSGRDAYIPTRAFYERNGYVQAAVLPHFYAPNDAKITYVKCL